MQEHIIYEAKANLEKLGDNAYIRFYTDALRFRIHYTISEIISGNFPHVGISAREGIAVFFRKYDENTQKDFWKSYDLLAQDSEGVTINVSTSIREGEKIEVLIYGPILAHLEMLSVMTDNDSFFITPDSEKQIKERVFFIGGGETFGLGVTSVGLMFSNIYRRKQHASVSRLSFRQILTEKELFNNVEKMCNPTDYDLIIFEASKYKATSLPAGIWLDETLNKLSESKQLLIWHSQDETCWKEKDEVSKICHEYEAKYNNVDYLNLDFLFSDKYLDMCTYSFHFINDAANVLIYRAIEEKLQKSQTYPDKSGEKYGIPEICF